MVLQHLRATSRHGHRSDYRRQRQGNTQRHIQCPHGVESAFSRIHAPPCRCPREGCDIDSRRQQCKEHYWLHPRRQEHASGQSHRLPPHTRKPHFNYPPSPKQWRGSYYKHKLKFGSLCKIRRFSFNPTKKSSSA